MGGLELPSSRHRAAEPPERIRCPYLICFQQQLQTVPETDRSVLSYEATW